MKRITVLFLVVFSFVPVVMAQTKDSPRLQAITSFFDTIQIAHVYHGRCIDADAMPNENFVMNMSVVVGLLGEELIKIKPNLTAEQAAQAISQRSKIAQEALGKVFDLNGCDSEAAKEAKAAYDYYSDISSSQALMRGIESKTRELTP